jgi:O-antigen/teichoic acid export membrane protein
VGIRSALGSEADGDDARARPAGAAPHQRVIRHLGLYVGATVLSALSPLVYIPTVAHGFGSSGWGAIALGQSVGSAAAVLVAFGWIFDGPRRLAETPSIEHSSLLHSAIASQLYLLICAATVALPVAMLLAGAHAAAAAMSALAVVVGGLSPTWYFIGRSEPGRVLLLDGLPKITGSVAGSLLLAGGASLLFLPVAQLVVAGVGVLAAVRVGSGTFRLPLSKFRPRAVFRLLRFQAPFAATQLSSIVYINLPVTLVAGVAPRGLASFAAVDRLFRFGTTAMSPLTQLTQGWVGRSAPLRLHRMRRSLLAHSVAGVVAGVGMLLLGPLIQALLFRGRVPLSTAVLVPFAICFPIVMMTRALGLNVLTFLRRGDALARSAVAGALVALIGIPTLGHLGGVVGAAWGVLAAESVVLGWQAAASWKALVRGTQGPAPISSPGEAEQQRSGS